MAEPMVALCAAAGPHFHGFVRRSTGEWNALEQSKWTGARATGLNVTFFANPQLERTPMTPPSLLCSWFRSLYPQHSRRPAARRRTLSLEPLEQRELLAGGLLSATNWDAVLAVSQERLAHLWQNEQGPRHHGGSAALPKHGRPRANRTPIHHQRVVHLGGS